MGDDLIDCKQVQETVHHNFSSWFWSAPVMRNLQKGTLGAERSRSDLKTNKQKIRHASDECVACFQLHWLWILPLVVVTEQKAGQGTSSVRPQFMKTSGQQIYESKKQTANIPPHQRSQMTICSLTWACPVHLLCRSARTWWTHHGWPWPTQFHQETTLLRWLAGGADVQQEHHTRNIIHPSTNYYTAMSWISTSNMNFVQHFFINSDSGMMKKAFAGCSFVVTWHMLHLSRHQHKIPFSPQRGLQSETTKPHNDWLGLRFIL